MRILHVIESLEFGGAEKIVVSLANSMATTHDVTICCLKRIGALGAEVDRQIEVFSLDKREGTDPWLPLRLARRLSLGRFDVIHTHNWATFVDAGIAAALAGTRARIHTVHGPYPVYEDALVPRIKKVLRNFLECRIAARFRRVAAVSDAIARYIIEDIGVAPDKVVTVHNGIPTRSEAPAARRASRDAVFVTVGRLAAIKNHALMLRAFGAARAAGARARLLLAGDGPERRPLEAQVRELGLGNSVEFLGFRQDIAAILHEADVFLLTSRYEGISVALLEAMRAGLPAIATRVGGIPETVLDGQTGLLFRADDQQGIAGAIVRLAASAEERLRMGSQARAFLEEEFSLERMVGRYLHLYAEPEGP